jgi:DNA-binding transcriptional MerR regulator
MDEPQTRPTGPARGVPIGEAARQLGVPIPTLRSWELRYQVPPSERGASEHRRYSPEQLHGMRLMRDEIARGTRAALAAEKVRELLTQTGPAAEFIDGFLAASQRSDPLALREQLNRARASLGLAGCLDEVPKHPAGGSRS